MEYSEARVKDIFVDFLKSYKDERNELKYRIQISQLPAKGNKSVIVDYPDLQRYDTDLATSLVQEPDNFLRSFDDAAVETLNIENPLYADKIKKELHVRVRELSDKISLREVTKEQLNTLILVAGMVTRTSELRPLAVNAAFRCTNRHLTMVEQTGSSTVLRRPIKCETEGCGETRNFELDERKTEFLDFQVIKIQEMPEELPPGQLPQSFDVNMTGDLVNTARPGDRIFLTGIVKAESENFGGSSRKLFNTRIEANFTEQHGKRPEELEISREEEEEIKGIATMPGAFDRLVSSVAPAIFGHELHKEAALLLMVGSPQKSLPDGSTLRGDINILLVGDPGTAKSELLKYVARIAPRGLFTSGRGTTAAGLTAAVVKEKNGMMMLEAGATVLADLGVACLHPASKIIIDGRIVSVGDLAKGVNFVVGLSEGKVSEIGKLSGFVPTLNTETLKVENDFSTKLRRRWHHGSIVTLKLRSGFEVSVTPDHLLLDGNTLGWKTAGDFRVGDSVISPLLLPPQSTSEDLYLWNILPENTKVALTNEEKDQLKQLIYQKFESIAQAARILELPRLPSYFGQRLQPSLKELRVLVSALGVTEEWKSNLHIYDKSKLFENKITPEFAYVCGFILGDGHVSISKRRATITIHQSAVHAEYIEQLTKCWSKVFKTPFEIGKPRLEESVIRGRKLISNSYNWRVSRRVLASVYTYLTRDNLATILSLPSDVLAGLLSGLTDADGCVTQKPSLKDRELSNTWNVVYTFSSNRESNLNLLLGLRRFGCLGSYRRVKHSIGSIVVSGRRDCNELHRALSLSVKMRKHLPKPRRYNISGASEKIPSNPVAEIFRRVFDLTSRADLTRLGIWSSIYESKNLRRQASVTQVSKILSGFKMFQEEEKAALTRLTNSDYFHDNVISIENSNYDGFVYDIILHGKNHNFVADGTIVHNCIDEFDKMRDEDRSALHEVMEQQSYHPSVEIALADGSRTLIGDYVERLMRERKVSVIAAKNCEILPLSEGPELYSYDISSGTVKRIRVDRVSRHKSPKEFISIKYSNGRKILVTPEHPIFVYRDHEIKTVPASLVSSFDYVPAPRIIPNSSVQVTLMFGQEHGKWNKPATYPKALTLELSRILGYLTSKGHSYAGSSYEIGFSNTDELILSEAKDLFRDVFGITPSIAIKDGVTIQRYNSKSLFSWFGGNFPEIMRHAREKRAPAKILGSSVNMIREFLRAAFLGDGSIESSAVSYRTASPSLAEDYQDLLHKLGILSRIDHDRYNDSYKVCILGDSTSTFFEQIVQKWDRRFASLERFKIRSRETLRGHDTLPPQVAEEISVLLKSLGIKHSNYFWEHIKKHFGIDRSIAEKYLGVIEGKLSLLRELSRSDWTSLRAERLKIGLSQQKLADICHMKRSQIAYLEAGGYSMDADRLIDQLKFGVTRHAAALGSELERIRGLLEFRFFTILEAVNVPNTGDIASEWVYDVTVEPTHTFISKGVVLHNTASVAKGGIIATLNARTSILAAANPVDGKYDPYKNILDNVSLPIPLMTRFDLIFIIRDDPDPSKDETVARHILDMRAKSSFPTAPPIEFELLKKYIIYAKKLDPEFTEEASSRLSSYYIKLRREASPEQMSVTPRWLEGMIRLSIARARLLLHTRVNEDDALHAINLIERMLNTVAVDQATKKVDIGVLYNRPASEKGLREAALEVFKRLSGESKAPVEDKVFYEEMEKTGRFTKEQAEKVFQDMWKSGVIFEVRAHFFKKT